jgi:hypothetical protein
LSKRKRSQRDLLPRLSNGKSENSAKNSHYYTLSHFESVNLFYIHRSDCNIELELIESEIESEFEDSTMTNVKNPQVNAVYGYFADEKNQYFRVSVISEMEKKEGKDATCEVFCMDYGNKCLAKVECLFPLSEEIKQYAPQAICCKLNGFQAERIITDGEPLFFKSC